MSGHSHAKTVMHRKASEAEKRGKIFSKLARLISITARDGADPETNPRLRQALEEAKKANMPKENIERAIKRGTGKISGEALETFLYEALGPANLLLIIEGITDNKNRTISEIKQILQKYKGKLANEGSIKWNFKQRGIIVFKAEEKNREQLEMSAIEAGAEDIEFNKQNNSLEIYTKPEELETVKNKIEKQGIEIETAYLGWSAKEKTAFENNKENILKLLAELDDNDSVQKIYSNLKNL